MWSANERWSWRVLIFLRVMERTGSKHVENGGTGGKQGLQLVHKGEQLHCQERERVRGGLPVGTGRLRAASSAASSPDTDLKHLHKKNVC